MLRSTLQYLQGNISPGQTAPPAEADLHVVKPTVSFGDVSDLYVAATLWLGFAWQKQRGEEEEGGKNERAV